MLRRAFLGSLVSTVSIAAARSRQPGTTHGASGGWRKYAHNPVLGGSLGVCFDVSLLNENGNYRMWFSWRNKKASPWWKARTAFTGVRRRSFSARIPPRIGKMILTAQL
ncbi:exported hypothetical protein [Acidobacteriia bacterium SbA2]|nr:exported hypothetical protein [Acidobacteriia bacterium SbA2]